MLDFCRFPVDRVHGIEIRRQRLTAASLLRWSSRKAEDNEIFSQSSNISWEEIFSQSSYISWNEIFSQCSNISWDQIFSQSSIVSW